MLILLVFFCSFTRGQDAGYLELVKAEKQLQLLFGRLYSDSLSDREVLLGEIREIMSSALAMDGSMDFPWRGLDRIGVVTSDDEQVRIFTWHIAEDTDHYRYFGYMQVSRRRGNVELYELEDRLEQTRSQHIEQSVDNWHGKLYYSIITTSYRRDTYYTLLGMDFNDSRSNIKTVEVIEIRRNRPRFLEEMFYTGREQVDRMVFEYSTRVSVSVRYDEQLKMIIFDHLVPFHPIYQGDYKFYGPDGSFDGLEFEAGTWIYREDVDARNRN
ncbi:MAG: hypothetical protein ACQERV_09110 [Bacteroidota bacterium]